MFMAPVSADTDWARVAMNTAVVMDWAQTRDIHNHEGLYESNKILGKYPSDAEINRFFILELLGYNLAGEYLISKKYKSYFYGGMALMHTDAVLHNYSMGVKFKFD
jgi:hypothetical protein